MKLSFSFHKSGKKKKLLRLAEDTQPFSFLFFVSMLLGGLVTNTLLETTFHSFFVRFQTDTQLILVLNEKKHTLLFYFLFLHIKTFFLLVFFSYTNVWKLYSRLFLCYNGILQGVLCSFCLHHRNFPYGIPEYLCFIFPHCLIFAPLYLLCLLSFQRINEHLSMITGSRQKRELLFKQLPIYGLSTICLLLGSILEAFVNLPLLQHCLNH